MVQACQAWVNAAAVASYPASRLACAAARAAAWLSPNPTASSPEPAASSPVRATTPGPAWL